MFSLLVLATAALLPFAHATEGDGSPSLTLKEAIDLALSQNNEVRASSSSVDSARSLLRSSYGKFLPQVNADARWTVLDSPIELDLADIRAAMISSSAAAAQIATAAAGQPANATTAAAQTRAALNSSLPPFKLEIQSQHYWNASITATQPIFAGGKLIANTLAKKEGLGAAEEQDRATRDRIVTEVVSRYFQLQLMNDVVAIRKEVMVSSNTNRTPTGCSSKDCSQGPTKCARMSRSPKPDGSIPRRRESVSWRSFF